MNELVNFILDHEDSFKSKNRLSSLYSDFSNLKTTNPDGYRANVSAWTTALTNASRAGVIPGQGRLCLKIDNGLLKELELRNVGRPVALNTVLEDAVASNTIMPLKDYLEATNSIYEKKWVNFHVPSPWQVAKWGLRQVGIGGSTLSQGEFVILANVEAAAQAISIRLSTSAGTSTSSIYSLETFTHEFASVLSQNKPLTSADLNILLTYLTRDKHDASMLTSPETGMTTIKLGDPSSKVRPAPVTAHDETIANLRTLSLRLDQQIDTLHESIAALESTAREAISSSPPQKTRAMAALRTKKLANTTLERRQASLEQVSGVIFSIDDAATQVEMVKAMEASTGLLEDLNKQVGGVERVDSIMEGLREQMVGVEDVSKVIGTVGREGAGGMVDEEELDEEIEAMLREGKEKEDALKRQAEEENTELLRNQEAEKTAKLLESAPSVPEDVKDVDRQKEQEVAVSGSAEKDLERRLKLMSLDVVGSGSG